MNVSNRGLHHKTFQKHVKKSREPQTQCLDKFYAESGSAVKAAYKEVDPSFSRDITPRAGDEDLPPYPAKSPAKDHIKMARMRMCDECGVFRLSG
ncbi:hypothetical protein HPB50_003044 [Hyalomma asiaticum]|uniref:Uncharacterized protein n=1 Tax=Hyalomma asiaticum TaxID=266040 RepID=A0ACB7SDL4_HYAAI|nr:hypothetical protein HPB50_003044 [Hyalomma asiaticum]